MILPFLALQLLTVSNITLQRQRDKDSIAYRNTWDSSYDFIVVGAGTAGCVVAARLSENPDWKVLLIEAGNADNVINDIPALNKAFYNNPELDWLFYGQPEKHINTNINQNMTFHYQRGRGLGGSSSINGMNYVRGNEKDYDNWEAIAGVKGWTFKDVLPYFKIFENQTDIEILKKYPDYHGNSGPVPVSSITPYVTNPWIEILANAGYNNLIDFNGPERVNKSHGMNQPNIYQGRRISMATAYLEPNRNRPNLHILTRAFATKILFNDTNNCKRATGVQFYRDGVYYNVTATKETILSASSIMSPKLLLLSGIGPRVHLESHSIPVLADLPVGENLHDGVSVHHTVPFNFSRNMDNEINLNNLYQLYVNGSGPLANVYEFTSYAVFSTKYNTDLRWPDAAFKIHGRTVETYIIRARSRGYIRLNSTDPFDHPLIKTNIFDDPYDLNVMIESLKELYRVLINTSYYEGFVRANNRSLCDNKCDTNISTMPCDEFLKCVAVEYSYIISHTSSTCQMGNDSNAVVDERLKVRRFQGLRVIDVSVVPAISDSFASFSSAILIGEKGSRLVIDDNTDMSSNSSKQRTN